MRGTWRGASAALVVLAINAAVAQRAAAEVVQPWEAFGPNFVSIYSWPNVMFTASAFAATPVLVYTLDEPLQERVQENDPLSDPFGETMNYVGGWSPIVVPVLLYGIGAAAQADELTTAGSAALQTLVTQFIVVSTLKWFADRAAPYPDGDPARVGDKGTFPDAGHPTEFDFSFHEFDRGLWPSGHTASNFALVSSLVAFYPNEIWLPIVGYPFALAVGLGMIEGDYHWLSDVVAGGLMGHAIGWVIGRNFRKRFDERNDWETARAPRGPEFEVVPMPYGLAVAYHHD